ncbi:probable mitochondrial adenine nucleotide transporter BTL3 [Chenopodium quinoa]|uniref:probable mitochondrial adenine nucleotide transporter BTL3 n=1 Tax=Chenopodium quinoa TaxID=63459 RepID=UPI000B77A80D|nr:probable mitochondrial adenine nucleotide transporter BTL3 [Chenopodium quinoa]
MPNSDAIVLLEHYPSHSSPYLFAGGLFLDPTIPPSFLNCISSPSSINNTISKSCSRNSGVSIKGKRVVSVSFKGVFSSISLKDCSNGFVNGGEEDLGIKNVVLEKEKVVSSGRGAAAMNSSKHFWAGAVAAMVARTVVAPLERLKLEYIVRGEQKNISELVKTIAATQGLRGFWKGNLLNILRTAPFKAINFCAYDTYRKQLRKLHLMDKTANFERFIAGAAAGITASVLCLPLDTIRTRIVAHGGENLGGIIGAFRYMIQTEGYFSLYKGFLPSILSIAPSSAVFYGVYDILKTSYLNSPEGRERILKTKSQGQDITALGQLELGPLRTLLYGAISGACAETATYPLEVIRRQLQLQAHGARLSTPATFMKIVEQGGIPALYAGLLPSVLQVLPSAAISYFVYECMKIVLKAE